MIRAVLGVAHNVQVRPERPTYAVNSLGPSREWTLSSARRCVVVFVVKSVVLVSDMFSCYRLCSIVVCCSLILSVVFGYFLVFSP